MSRRNLDTQGIGKRAFTQAQTVIQDSGHLIQAIDGDIDIGIDAYIRIRKRTKFKKIENHKVKFYEDWVDTGNLVGIQVKGVSAIPKKGSNSYYITRKDKTTFGVNFNSKENLDSKRKTWQNFVGPVILVFVDLETKDSWWTDLLDENSYDDNSYSVIIKKNQVFNQSSFKSIKRLGKELFKRNELLTISTKNFPFIRLSVGGFKESARELYNNLKGEGEFPFPETINPTLGGIKFSQSGWKHITRLNRRQMRIINSLILLGVAREICEKVTKYSKVKKGMFRESERYIKKVEFLTLRANIEFNYRQESIVQVVLRRVKTFDKIHPEQVIQDQIFFHSVYEPYRKE